jgi:hypothetical protein
VILFMAQGSVFQEAVPVLDSQMLAFGDVGYASW